MGKAKKKRRGKRRASSPSVPAPKVALSTPANGRPPSLQWPCTSCGKTCDRLRAHRVVARMDGVQMVYCSEACRLSTKKASQRGGLIARVEPSFEERVRDSTIARYTPLALQAADRTPNFRAPLFLAGCALTSFILALFDGTVFTGLSSLVSVIGGVVALMSIRASRQALGVLLSYSGPVAALLAAGFALIESKNQGGAFDALMIASFALMATGFREWVLRESRKPQQRIERRSFVRAASTARVVIKNDSGNDRYEEVDDVDVRSGDMVFVLDGEILPVDGTALTPASVQAFGYADAEPVASGDMVYAGGRVVNGPLQIRAEATGDARSFARHLSFVSTQNETPKRSEFATFITRFSLVGVVVALALFAFLNVVTFSELPLAIATLFSLAPLASARHAVDAFYKLSAFQGAQRGVYFDNPEMLERCGTIDTVACFLHGTLTEHDVRVREMISFDDIDEPEMIALAASLYHPDGDSPLGNAIHEYATDRGVSPALLRNISELASLGAKGVDPSGATVCLGDREELLAHGISVASAEQEARAFESSGAHVLFLASAGKVRAFLVYEDRIRSSARPAVQRFYDLRSDVVMLTHAHSTSAHAIASQLDIAHVRADIDNQSRAENVKALSEGGRHVALVAPTHQHPDAAQGADLPIYLRGKGPRPASPGVRLARLDLRLAADALAIGRQMRSMVGRVVWSSAILFALFSLAAATGFLPKVAAITLGLALEAIVAFTPNKTMLGDEFASR